MLANYGAGWHDPGHRWHMITGSGYHNIVGLCGVWENGRYHIAYKYKGREHA